MLGVEAGSFVQKHGCATSNWQALPADASSRRYFRQVDTPYGACLLMVTAPDAPDLIAYMLVADHLKKLGLSAPSIHAADVAGGLALIEDFGNSTYTRLLSEGGDETMLYDLAIDALAVMHNKAGSNRINLPAYDMATLLREAALFPDWFAPTVVGARNLDQFATQYETLFRNALADVATRRDALVLRDFHVDNLILLSDRHGVTRCGLLDFQDALIGSPAYDVMSLMQDARRDLAPALEDRAMARYLAARPGLDRVRFMQDFHVLAAQRHAKVAGIFNRLAQRDGKPHYLAHVPRVLRLLDRALSNAGMYEMRALMDAHLPDWQTTN